MIGDIAEGRGLGSEQGGAAAEAGLSWGCVTRLEGGDFGAKF